ncbi:MAG: nuclear transport factor 2 family protein [Waterburya sp.]
MQTEITVSIENLAPNGGQMIAPVWVALHDGSFDLFDEGAPASAAIEAMAEDGFVGNLPSESVEQLINRGIDLDGVPAPEETIAGTFDSSQAGAGVQNVVFSAENLPDQLPTEFEVVEELLSSISAGDRDEFLSLQTTDVVWEVEGNEVPVTPTEVRDTEVIPFAGDWFGTIGISQTAGDFFDELQSSLDIETFEPLDFFREGEQALARVHLEATVTETGLPLDLDLAYRIELETAEDGRELVESVQLVYNSYPVAEAFVAQEPSAEAVALSARDPLTGAELSNDAAADSAVSLQVVRDAYEALQIGDIESYIEAFSEDSIVTLNADPAILATGNVWEGQDGLEELLTEVVPSLDFSIRAINPTDIIANGDRVAVFTNWENSNSRTGLNGSFPLTQFLTVQDGEIINGQFIFDTHIPATLLSGEPIFDV